MELLGLLDFFLMTPVPPLILLPLLPFLSSSLHDSLPSLQSEVTGCAVTAFPAAWFPNPPPAPPGPPAAEGSSKSGIAMWIIILIVLLVLLPLLCCLGAWLIWRRKVCQGCEHPLRHEHWSS